MIFFVVPAEDAWGIEEYLQQYGGKLVGRLQVVTYEDIVARPVLRLGTHIFSALDQLCPAEREIAACCWAELAGASPGITLINHPTEALLR